MAGKDEMKILSYRMTHDTGFAPNPFWDYLTLAACTPNHVRAKLNPGDFLVGVESNQLRDMRQKAGLCSQKDNLIVYIAEIDEVLTLDQYYHDPKFVEKKYSSTNWKTRRGDNVYYKVHGKWKWTPNHMHANNKHAREQDMKGDRVFIAKNFSYFGDKCIEFDEKFISCIKETQGIKYCRSKDNNFQNFQKYLQDLMQQNGKGQIGMPIMQNDELRILRKKEKT